MPRRDYSKELYCQEGARRGSTAELFKEETPGNGEAAKEEKKGGVGEETANDVLKCNSTFMKYSLP